MRSKSEFGMALKQLREIKEVTQEDFGLVSSRTYISTVERGLKSPTLGKIEQISEVLGVHPLTLMAIGYMDKLTRTEIERVTAALRSQLLEVISGK
jgi:transcriptional regulator with XRE-family HTH domain